MAHSRLRRAVVAALTALIGALLTSGRVAVLQQNAAPAQVSPAPATAPAVQAAVGPGRVQLPPGGAAAFVYAEVEPDTDAHRVVAVKSMAHVPAQVVAGDSQLTVQLPAGFAVVPDGDCTPGDDLSTASCPGSLPGGLVFAAADLAAATPFPIEAEVPGLGSAVLVGRRSDGTEPPAIVALAYDPLPAGFAATASFAAQWDGVTLTVTPPDGYAITASDAANAICAPQNDGATALQCAVDGSVPELLHFRVAPLTPSRHPATPVPVLASIASPRLDGRTIEPVGQRVLFAATGTPGLAYLWDFGDGVLQPGQAVQHGYAKPGVYSARLVVVGFSGATRPPGIIDYQRVLVPVGVAPLQVGYRAGWNLVAGPAGTEFSGAATPLYFLPFPPCRAIPTPPTSTATPQPVPSPVVGQPYPALPASCDTGYQTAPADHVLTVEEAGQGFWAYFPRTTTVVIPYLEAEHGFWIMPGGRWVMIGNPNYRPVRVDGPDVVLVYDTGGGRYQQTTVLQPGQGAWAYASASVNLTLTPIAAGASP